MNKRIIAIILATLLLSSLMVSCVNDQTAGSVVSDTLDASSMVSDAPVVSDDVDEGYSQLAESQTQQKEESDSSSAPTSQAQSAVSSAPVASKPSSGTTSSEPVSSVQKPEQLTSSTPVSSQPTQTVDLAQIHQAVKDAYGEYYLPNSPVEDISALTDLFGVNTADVAEFFIDMPLMSAHIDKFIGIKCNVGTAKQVAEALESYLNNEIENGMHYPSNVPKVKAAQVVSQGDYVFFVMLGQQLDIEVDPDSAQALAFAQEQVAIGVNVIKSMLA